MGFSFKKLLDPLGVGSIAGKLFGGDSNGGESIERPKYYTDPAYTETQASLKGLGLGLIEGKVPDYYKSIGETGGTEFENMLGLTTRDIQKSTAETMASRGAGRGGNVGAVTAGAVADAAVKARYSDYDRSLTGKQNLLNLGVNTTQGVRGAAQLEGGRTNEFNWKDYNAQVKERAYQKMLQDEEDAQLGELIGTIANVGMGVATGGVSGGVMALTGNQAFSNLFSPKTARESAGVSDIGSIDLNDYKLSGAMG